MPGSNPNAEIRMVDLSEHELTLGCAAFVACREKSVSCPISYLVAPAVKSHPLNSRDEHLEGYLANNNRHVDLFALNP